MSGFSRTARDRLRRLSVVVLVDEEILIPGTARFRAGLGEKPIIDALQRLVSSVTITPFKGIADTLEWLDRLEPDVVFNLTEHVDEDRTRDAHICALLDLKGVAYTGTGQRGMVLCRDKAVSKLIAQNAGFRTPRFWLTRSGARRLPAGLEFPVVVKPLRGDSSEGIAQSSLVRTGKGLRRRMALMDRKGYPDLICEEFMEGREMVVGIVDEHVFHPREFIVGRSGPGAPVLASANFKQDRAYRRRWRVRTEDAKLTPAQLKKLNTISRAAFDALELRDYGRLDLKLSPRDEWAFLEANPNPPTVPPGRSFSGCWAGMDFDELIGRITWSAAQRR